MIEAIIHGFANVGKPSTFSVKISDDTGNTHKRIVPLMVKSAYTAELAAIMYTCQSLSDKDCNLVIKTSTPHIAKLFKKKDGKWATLRKNKNLDFIKEIRALSENFKSFACQVLDKNDVAMQQLRASARKPVRS